MTSCATCIVRNSAICGALSNAELATLNKIGRRRTLEAGETLIWEGEESVLVANVIDGVLKVTTSLKDGREQIVGIACPSDFLGRPFGENAGQSVVALSDAKVCLFAREAFDGFAREHPDLQTTLLERILGELDLSRRWMLLLSRKTASERVATFILEMSQRLADHGCAAPGGSIDTLRLPFGRQQMADILGMTIETVGRQLTELKKRGVIRLPSRQAIEIVDRAALEALA